MGLGSEGLLPGLLGHDAADVDEIISDHAEADPALHSGIAPVAAAIETVSPLDHADATLASGAPFLAVSGLLGALDSGDIYYHGAQLADVQKAAGHRDSGTTKLYDRRGCNPEKAASFFANY